MGAQSQGLMAGSSITFGAAGGDHGVTESIAPGALEARARSRWCRRRPSAFWQLVTEEVRMSASSILSTVRDAAGAAVPRAAQARRRRDHVVQGPGR